MLEYKTTGIVKINCGYVGLDKKQADARRHYIRPADDGTYEVMQPVMFKAGEKVRLNNPDKHTLEKLELIEKAIVEPVETPEPPEPVKKPVRRKTKAKK
jgi:hypothetical protein